MSRRSSRGGRHGHRRQSHARDVATGPSPEGPSPASPVDGPQGTVSGAADPGAPVRGVDPASTRQGARRARRRGRGEARDVGGAQPAGTADGLAGGATAPGDPIATGPAPMDTTEARPSDVPPPRVLPGERLRLAGDGDDARGSTGTAGDAGATDRRPGRAPGDSSRETDGATGSSGGQRGASGGCTLSQLRRFVKSRPYVPLHELRRRFALNGYEDDVVPIEANGDRLYVGLPEREAHLLEELLRQGEVGYERSLDPPSPIIVGVYPMRPVPRA